MDATTLEILWSEADDPERPWAFLVSASGGRLERSEHSAGLVFQALRPVLERLGSVRLLCQPESRLVFAAARASAEGYRPVHLSLDAPHRAYLTPAVPTVLFPLWGSSQIPGRDVGVHPRRSWARTLRRANLLLTASTFTAEALRRAGIDVPTAHVPVPVPAELFHVPAWDPRERWTLDCRHLVWGGVPTGPVPRGAAVAPLHDALPLRGAARIERSLRRHYRRIIRPLLGETLAMGIQRARDTLRRRADPPPPRIPNRPLTLSGLVYTSSLDLSDPRNNLSDLLRAFLSAFRQRPDVTLLLKLDTTTTAELHELQRIGRLHRGLGLDHHCRIVALTDNLSAPEMQRLYQFTTYYVNTSHVEDLCHPLQQALASGRPVIAPAHTAMADYVDARVGFVLDSHPEPAPWPHDPRGRPESAWHRLDWSDLREQFLRSARVAESERGTYRELAAAARERMAGQASQDAAAAALRLALARMRPGRPGASDWAA